VGGKANTSAGRFKDVAIIHHKGIMMMTAPLSKVA
jgi:hypothetical protein